MTIKDTKLRVPVQRISCDELPPLTQMHTAEFDSTKVTMSQTQAGLTITTVGAAHYCVFPGDIAKAVLKEASS